MTRKFFSLMACAALLAGLVACGDNEDPAPAPDNSGNTEEPGGGEKPGGGEEEPAIDLFPEGYYMTYTAWNEAGDTPTNQCVMLLTKESETEYEMLNILNTGYGFRGRANDDEELVFNCDVYEYEKEANGNLTGERVSVDENGKPINVLGKTIRIWLFSDMNEEELAYYQGGFPESDRLAYFITPIDVQNQKLVPAKEYIIYNRRGELYSRTGMAIMFQGVKMNDEGKLVSDKTNKNAYLSEMIEPEYILFAGTINDNGFLPDDRYMESNNHSVRALQKNYVEQPLSFESEWFGDR